MNTISYWRNSLYQSNLFSIPVVTAEEQLAVQSLETDDSWMEQKGKNEAFDSWISEAESSDESGLRNDDLSLYYLNEKGEVTAALLAEEGEENTIRIRRLYLRKKGDLRAFAIVIRNFIELLDVFLLDYEKVEICHETDKERLLYEKLMDAAVRTEETMPEQPVIGGQLPKVLHGDLQGAALVKLNTLDEVLSEQGCNTTFLYERMMEPVLGISCGNSSQALLIRYRKAGEVYVLSALEDDGSLYEERSYPDGTPAETIAEEYIIPAFEMLSQEN